MNMVKPLGWGVTIEDYQAVSKSLVYAYSNEKMAVKEHVLSGFPGDCGTLLMNNSFYATAQSLKDVAAVASAGGFSKIIATIAMEDGAERMIKLFTDHKWKLAAKGTSNRNPHKTDAVLVKYIRNCKYKGY